MLKRIRYNSPVILSFALLSMASLLLGILTNQTSTVLLFSVYRANPFDLLFYFRLIGHVLGHANFEHYINNFLLILIIGPMLEEKYGSKNMLIMILITAFITGVASLVITSSALLGASGIVFMLILLSSFANFKKGTVPLTLIFVIIIYLGREITNAIITKDNISQYTHVIGGICGFVFGYFYSKNMIDTIDL